MRSDLDERKIVAVSNHVLCAVGAPRSASFLFCATRSIPMKAMPNADPLIRRNRGRAPRRALNVPKLDGKLRSRR